MFKSIGKLIYEPYSHVGSTKNWLVLMCDDEISKYYRFLYEKEHKFLNGNYGKLQRPIFGTHISLIRGEKIPNRHLWNFKANSLIEFEYEHETLNNGEYFWQSVKCDALLDIRSRYGLTRHPKFGLHLTIGRTIC